MLRWLLLWLQPKPELTEDDVRQDRGMREAFKKIAGEDMEIDAYELQDIINAAFMKGNQNIHYSSTKYISIIQE